MVLYCSVYCIDGSSPSVYHFASHHWKLDSISDRINGDNTLVAILSTGIQSDHIVFAHHNVVLAKNFVGDNTKSCADSDPGIIGTAVASVVAGSHIKPTSSTEKYVCKEGGGVLPVGVAPNTSLVACRVIKAGSENNPQAVQDALQWIFNHNAAVEKEASRCDCTLDHHRNDEIIRDKNKIRIVLLAFKLEKNVLAVGDLIDDLKKQGTVCIAGSDSLAQGGTRYPAAYGNVLSIGISDSQVDGVALSDNTVCAGLEKGLQITSGSIFSASAVVGLIALLLQSTRKHAQEKVTCERIMTVDVLRFLFQEWLMEGDSKLLTPEKVFEFFTYKLDNLDSIVKNALGL